MYFPDWRKASFLFAVAIVTDNGVTTLASQGLLGHFSPIICLQVCCLFASACYCTNCWVRVSQGGKHLNHIDGEENILSRVSGRSVCVGITTYNWFVVESNLKQLLVQHKDDNKSLLYSYWLTHIILLHTCACVNTYERFYVGWFSVFLFVVGISFICLHPFCDFHQGRGFLYRVKWIKMCIFALFKTQGIKSGKCYCLL